MIGNRYDDCELACWHCGTQTGLMQVAHRNSLGQVVGYLFLCGDCLKVVSKNYSVTLVKVGGGAKTD